ncbi:AhpC/TSA family protein [Palleronia sediminis]|uniref:AhpC/TSA family protein n=1 Tax=Palleronia sediminis TaxID=2547833 RepID=A0A4R6AA68_9RHOB|nr:peroxiredoxin-like family protein [Palleronia sediminis]TDL79815.1 AhpC/TSA family protein [Palleronia sediminis]
MPQTPVPRQPAPALDLPLIIGTRWRLSEQSPERFTQVVVYRGLHCPICQSYLKTLKRHYGAFVDKGVETICVSMEGRERVQQAYDDWGLDDIPMGYDLDRAQAEDWGLYMSSGISDAEPEVFAEPAVFWIRPGGELYLANISNVPFARPDLGQLLDAVDYVTENDYPARGDLAA